MIFKIHMGEPEIKALWDDLIRRKKETLLNLDEDEFMGKWVKATHFLSHNPRHPSLNTHEIEDLSKNVSRLMPHNNSTTSLRETSNLKTPLFASSHIELNQNISIT
jgi:hypothetical protein